MVAQSHESIECNELGSNVSPRWRGYRNNICDNYAHQEQRKMQELHCSHHSSSIIQQYNNGPYYLDE